MAFKNKEDANAYINKYHRENYDKIILLAPKGSREIYKAAAKVQGLTLSKFVVGCVEEKIERMKNPDSFNES